MDYKKEYLELLGKVRQFINKEKGINALKEYRPSFEALLELFEQGEQDYIIQEGDAVLEWRETAIGLIKAVWEPGADEPESFQIVGERKVYYG